MSGSKNMVKVNSLRGDRGKLKGNRYKEISLAHIEGFLIRRIKKEGTRRRLEMLHFLLENDEGF